MADGVHLKRDELEAALDGIRQSPRDEGTLDLIVCRPRVGERRVLDEGMLDPADGLWIAWPKKAASIESDLTFEAVQEVGLAHGLVDNKSCSIDERWQALRFVYRLADR